MPPVWVAFGCGLFLGGALGMGIMGAVSLCSSRSRGMDELSRVPPPDRSDCKKRSSRLG